jgi:DNA polymerase III subunit delta'
MSIYSWQQPLWQQLWQADGLKHHALLIQGRAGIGKRDFAFALAQSLLCESRNDHHQACGTCQACHWFAQGNHPDFRLVEPEAMLVARDEAGEGGDSTSEPDDSGSKAGKKKPSDKIIVDQVRNIEDFLTVSTHRGGKRVVMIHPAEAMNANAANAILKMLEEPRPDTLFLLVTHEPKRLLPTVISRCRRLVMPVPDPTESSAWLAAQGIEQSASLLAQAGGAPLAALTLADGEYQASRREWLQGLAQGRAVPFSTLAESQPPPAQAVNWMQTWCYDLLALKTGVAIRYNTDYADALRKIAQGLPTPALMEWDTMLKAAKRMVNHPVNPQLFLEQLLMFYAQAAR